MALLFTPPRSVQVDAVGQLMSGWTVEFYQTLTSTPKTVYADAALTVPLGTSVSAGDEGSLPPIYLDDSGTAYKIIIKDADGNVVPNGTIDPYLIGPSQGQIGAALYPRSVAETSAGVTPSIYAAQEGYLQRYGGVGDGVVVSTTVLTSAAAQSLQSTGSSVKISGGTYRLDADTAVSAGVTLDFTEGGKLSIDSGVTLTINGKVLAAPGQQIFTGSGSVVFGIGSVAEVYPDWWGSGVNAVKSAHTAVTGKYIPVRLLEGKTYQFSSKLSITNSGDAIIGPNQNNDTAGGVFSGTTLEFTGSSGTAIEVGAAPGSNGNFVYKITLAGFNLKVTENTDISLRLWHVAGRSHIRDLTLRGNSDNDTSDNIGFQVEGGVDIDVERVLVFGQGALGTGASLLQNGIKVLNGFAASPTTTTRFRQCYISQCNFGVNVTDDSAVAFDHCVFESNYDAGFIALNARVLLLEPWFEANGTSGSAPLRVQGAASVVTLLGGLVNAGTIQNLISVEANCVVNLLGGTRFSSSHGSPRLFSLGGTQPTLCITGTNTYPASMSDSDTSVTKFSKIEGGLIKLPSYTVSGIPSVVGAGLIYVSDESGGAVPAFSDGTNWRRVTDRAIVS